MLKNENELINIFKQYQENNKKIADNNNYLASFYNSFLAGTTELIQKQVTDTKIFDEEWIKTVESYFPSLNKIVMNPRSSVKREEVIVEIEKAKKVDSASIKHLSANTHMLREVTKDGEVIPKKILTSYSEIDYTLYENRFIMTLIDRLFIFVRTRYETIKNNVESFEKRNVSLKSEFPLNETKIDINLNITLTDESSDKEINEYNKKLLKRVEELDRLVTSLKTHTFMDLMKSAKKIYPPILKTNIIIKDVDYHNAYLLWLFLDQYNTLTFKLNLEEKNLPFDDKYLEDMKHLVFHNVGTIINNHHEKRDNYQKINPQISEHQSIKVITDSPSDIKLPAEDLIIEDNQINEYYLETYKKLLSKSLDYHQSNSKTLETSLKRALRDTLKISESLYQAYFMLEEETDIFKMLITDIDVDKEIREIKHKIFVSKMIREVKEVDYNNTLRNERRLIKELDKYYDLIKKDYENKIKNNKQSLIDEKTLIKNQKVNDKHRQKLDLELANVKALKEHNEELRSKSLKAFNDYQSALNHKLRDELKTLEDTLINQMNKEVKTAEAELELIKRLHEERLINQEKTLEEEFSIEYALAETKFNEDLIKESKKLEEHYLNKLKLRKAEIRTEIQLEKIKSLKELEDRKMKIRGKRQRQRVEHRKIINNNREKIIKMYEEKLRKLEE